MGKREKRFNKWLIGLVIGGAIVGGMSRTEKGKVYGKSIIQRIKRSFRFFGRGIREIRKTAEKNTKK